MSNKTIDMTRGSPLRLIVGFALPLMFGNVFQQLYTVVDTAIVGQGVGMEALAALGAVDWLTWLFLGVVQGFTQGFSVRFSQKYGEKDIPDLKRMLGQSARLCIFIALIGVAVGQVGIPLFMKLLRVSDVLAPMSEIYLRIILGGLPVVVFFNFCSSALRAVGDSRTPLVAMAVASVANILLDALAVFVLGWGIGGAAIATVVSQFLSGLICLVAMLRIPELRFGRKDLNSAPEYQKNLLRIGSPIAAKNVGVALGGMVLLAVVNGFDVSFIAGYTASNKLYGLLEIAAVSYGYAVTTYVGQNFGAREYHRIRKGVRAATLISLATSVAIGTVMIIFGRFFTSLFINADDPLVAQAAGDTAYVYLCVMSLCLPALYLLYVYLFSLQGMGNTVVPMISGFVELFLRTSAALAVAFTGFAYGIFGAEVIAWLGAAIILGIWYYRSVKKFKPEI